MLPLLLSVLFVLPADTVSGRVVDNAGQAVPQAIVEITQLGKSVTAGADGGFRLSLTPGRYTLAVRHHGFAPVVREISVGAAQPTLEITLTPSESLRSAMRRRKSPRSPASNVHRPDPALHCSNAKAALEKTFALGTIGSRPLASLRWPTIARPNVRPPCPRARKRQPARGLFVE
ncbi:MAG: carboxypeptidase regulatory-like domain-containing protein [Betaproteobacteria bacterium]|nr:MAG: carboxypeptidase regulatory-like domain-containing protein [Betaproteobacteria bacterium]